MYACKKGIDMKPLGTIALLQHRYSFNVGSIASDSVGGDNWLGTFIYYASVDSGHLSVRNDFICF